MPGKEPPVGLWSPAGIWEPDTVAEIAAEVEELGYRMLWIGGASPDLALPETILRHTRYLRVATGIVSVWAAPARELAARYAEVAAAYPGRLLLGLGASHDKLVGAAYARPYQKMVDYLDELDAAAPPLAPGDRLLAALGPRMTALAGARSRGAHPYLTTPEHTATTRSLLGPDRLLAPELMVVPERDPGRAREIARERLALYLGLPNYLRSFARMGFTEADFTGGGSDRLVDTFVAWGDVEAIADRIREHHRAGADHVAVQVLRGGAEPGLPRREWRDLAPALTAL